MAIGVKAIAHGNLCCTSEAVDGYYHNATHNIATCAIKRSVIVLKTSKSLRKISKRLANYHPDSRDNRHKVRLLSTACPEPVEGSTELLLCPKLNPSLIGLPIARKLAPVYNNNRSGRLLMDCGRNVKVVMRSPTPKI